MAIVEEAERGCVSRSRRWLMLGRSSFNTPVNSVLTLREKMSLVLQ